MQRINPPSFFGNILSWARRRSREMRRGAIRPEPLVWSHELVSRFWDGVSKAGLDAPVAFGRQNKEAVLWLTRNHLAPGGRHLDYGSGDGELAAYLIRKGYPFAVFEPSLDRQSRSNSALNGIEGFLGAAGAADAGTFDVVTCFEVIEHLLDDDFERVCDEIAAYVRPGGKLIISCPNSEDLALSTVYCPVSNKMFHRWQHVRSISPDMMSGIWRIRGFEKIALHQLDFSRHWYEPYLHMLGPEMESPTAKGETIPLHIHQINRDMDGVIGGASNILFVAKKTASRADALIKS